MHEWRATRRRTPTAAIPRGGARTNMVASAYRPIASVAARDMPLRRGKMPLRGGKMPFLISRKRLRGLSEGPRPSTRARPCQSAVLSGRVLLRHVVEPALGAGPTVDGDSAMPEHHVRRARDIVLAAGA